MKYVKQIIVSAVIAVTALAGASGLLASTAAAVDPSNEISKGLTAAGGRDTDTLQPQIQTVINVLLFIIGAVAVIMIIVGGIKYVVSNGDSAQITSAKNTILYAVIGLVVALLAYAIVGFVINQFARP